MSRSGLCEAELYSQEECWQYIRWRGAVNSAIRGKRGQKLLKELAESMDQMPEKRLIANYLVSDDGEFCALGVVGRKRGIDLSVINDDEPLDVASAFDIAEALAREVTCVNDEMGSPDESPEWRWRRVRKWVQEQISG